MSSLFQPSEVPSSNQVRCLVRSNCCSLRRLGQTIWNSAADGRDLRREALNPVGVVELSIVGLDLGTIGGQDHVVDTVDIGIRLSASAPSPGDVVAAEVVAESGNDKLWLANTLVCVK